MTRGTRLRAIFGPPGQFLFARCHRKIFRPEIVSRRQFFRRKLSRSQLTKEIMSPGSTVARMLAIGILYFRQRRVICDEGGCSDIEIRHLNACMYMQV